MLVGLLMMMLMGHRSIRVGLVKRVVVGGTGSSLCLVLDRGLWGSVEGMSFFNYFRWRLVSDKRRGLGELESRSFVRSFNGC